MPRSKTVQMQYISGSNATVAGTVAGVAGKSLLIFGIKVAGDQVGRYVARSESTAGTSTVDADRYSSAAPAAGWIKDQRPVIIPEGRSVTVQAISGAAANIDTVVFWDIEDPS